MLAQNVKQFRKEYKLSQEDLAKKAGITYSTLIKIESGANTNPTLKTVCKLAKAFNVTVDALLKQ